MKKAIVIKIIEIEEGNSTKCVDYTAFSDPMTEDELKQIWEDTNSDISQHTIDELQSDDVKAIYENMF